MLKHWCHNNNNSLHLYITLQFTQCLNIRLTVLLTTHKIGIIILTWKWGTQAHRASAVCQWSLSLSSVGAMSSSCNRINTQNSSIRYPKLFHYFDKSFVFNYWYTLSFWSKFWVKWWQKSIRQHFCYTSIT